MARATQQRASDAPRDAIALLKQDHRMVETLIDEFEDADEDQQQEIGTRICQLLTVHAQIEEEILYPEAQQALDEEDAELVHEAEVEHGSAKDLIAKIESVSAPDDTFKATVKVLGEYVKHHVKEEEGELFPKLRKTELDLKELGQRLASRKFELMEQMGIESEEEAATTSKSRRRPAARRASRSTTARASAKGRQSSRTSSSRAARH